MSDPDITGGPAAVESAPERQAGAGAALLKERRRQGLSLGDVSRQLKLSVRQVEALERDDYSAYKGPVFIHGFIRNYAKLLGLASEPLIRATDAMLNPPQIMAAAAREPEQVRSVGTEKKKTRRRWPAVVAVVVVGVAISIYIGGRRAPDVVRNAPTGAARDTPAPATKTPAEPKASAEGKSKADPKPEEVVTKSATKPDKKPEARTETKAESPVRRAPVESGGVQAEQGETSARVTVRMIFEQESWVEIKDRSGNTIFGQLNPAGSRRTVSGDPPLSVVVGHAAGVRLFQGDKNIDLAPHTRVDVARLTLE